MPDSQIELLLETIDDAYSGVAWHGPTLRGSIGRAALAEAAWKPAAPLRSVAELTVHSAYWKYAVWRRLTGAKRGSFPIKGSNWFDIPSESLTEAQWRGHLTLLDEMHAKLRAAVAEFDPSRLTEMTAGNENSFTLRRLIAGIALHDVYHAGQIQYVRQLYRARP